MKAKKNDNFNNLKQTKKMLQLLKYMPQLRLA